MQSISNPTAPKFAAKGTNTPARPQRNQALGMSQAPDSVRFGKGKDTQKSETVDQPTETSGADKAPKRQYWQAAKAGLKAAFSLKGLGLDFALGLALTAVVALIPPHLHALAMLPLWMTMGVVIRGFQGTANAL